MNFFECQFELAPQPCFICGEATGQLGTCRDIIACDKCCTDMDLDSETLIYLAEKEPYLRADLKSCILPGDEREEDADD